MATAILIMRGQVQFISEGSSVSVMLPELCNNGTTVVPVPVSTPLKSLVNKNIQGNTIELDEFGQVKV